MATVGPAIIEKTPGVCGGQARVRNSRIPVWHLVAKHKLGESDAGILDSYPALTQADLDAAWDYYRDNPIEIEQSIWLNDTAANVPAGVPVPAAAIVAGRLLGLDGAAVRGAFDPPLPEDAIATAWAEYRADPARIRRASGATWLRSAYSETSLGRTSSCPRQGAMTRSGKAAFSLPALPQVATIVDNFGPGFRPPSRETAMPIRVACPTCKSIFPVDDAERGKHIRCRQCGALMAIPPAASPPDAISTGPPPLPTVAQSRAADEQRDIDPRRRSSHAKSGARAMVPLVVVGGVLLLVVTCGTGFMGLMLWLRAAPAADVPVAQGEALPPAPVVEPPPEIVAPVMEGTIPVAVLQQIKDATVFVRMDAGAASGTGSGFLMRVDGDTAYFATNDHVVSPKSTIVSIGRLKPRLVAPPPARISVVLYSGTQREQTLPVEVVTADADADLAILRAVGARNLPAPIDFTKQVALVETMPVFVCGYPFGQALATNKSNPALTVGKGSISSLRTDEHGELDIVQLDGDLNPGNRSGPLVDARGRLVGVAVAKIRVTRIRLAIPTGDLMQLLAGRVRSGLVFKKQLAGNGVDVLGKASGTRMGRLVTGKAKDGYAVAGITAKAGLTVDGFSVRFMRVAGDGLDAMDAYTSEWIGGRGGGGETYIGGGNRRVVGIITTMNDNEDCTGLGLLLPP
jgi:S1-C subfamily serine protease/uncharacterized protein (DUF433 family)